MIKTLLLPIAFSTSLAFASSQPVDPRVEALKPMVMEYLLPSLSYPYDPSDKLESATVTVNQLEAKNNVGNTLVGYSFQPKDAAKRIGPKKSIIYFGGSGQTAQTTLSSAEYIFEELPTTNLEVLVFNYRGVAGSEGTPENFTDLVEDGVVAVHYAKDILGIAASDVVVFGFSLGAAIAVQVASRAHAEGFPLRLISDRAFGSLSCISKPILRLVLRSQDVDSLVGPLGLDVELTADYLSIPAEFRIHFYAKKDGAIPTQCSLQHLLQEQGQDQVFFGYSLKSADHGTPLLSTEVEGLSEPKSAKDIVSAFAF